MAARKRSRRAGGSLEATSDAIGGNSEPEGEKRELRVLTLNVFCGKTGAGKDPAQLGQQIALVAAHECDIIALQEAWEEKVLQHYQHAFRETHDLVRCEDLAPKLGAFLSPLCCAGSETAVRETAAREPSSSASVLLPLAEGREALPGIRRFGCVIG